MMATPPRGKRPAPEPPIPADWRVELPDAGDDGFYEFGSCRSIESGYTRQGVLGQGTYGEVFRAVDRSTGETVAAKKIKMENEKEGFPITAIREIKILSRLARSPAAFRGHLLRDNVVQLREIVRSAGHRGNGYRGSVYMVFEYADHDMTGLLERASHDGPRFTEPQVKGYLQQLLCGLALLGKVGVLHRDLKNANLLITNGGVLKIADFGLARYGLGGPGRAGAGGSPGRGGGGAAGGGGAQDAPPSSASAGARMTNRVITLWYRPPELFLGSERYGPEVDAWSAGCIAFEVMTGRPLFAAQDETGMVDRIFSILGRATEATMPGCSKLPNYALIDWSKFPPAGSLARYLRSRGIKSEEALDLLCRLLTLDPAKRIDAATAVAHEWFSRPPLPLRPEQMPKYESSHEMGMKKAHQAAKAAAGGAHPAGRGGGRLPATGGASWQKLRR